MAQHTFPENACSVVNTVFVLRFWQDCAVEILGRLHMRIARIDHAFSRKAGVIWKKKYTAAGKYESFNVASSVQRTNSV